MSERRIIINIGRQIGSGGLIIARQLASHFGFTFYDRNLLNLAAKESGFSEKFFEKSDERKGFFQSLVHTGLPFAPTGAFYQNNFSEESLYQFQSDAIRKAAESGSCVFVGRTADYVLRDMDNVVNVFITADLSERIARVMERHGIDEEQARKYIEKREEDRANYYNYYTGKRWGAAESYDLCLSSTALGIEGTVKLLAGYINQRFALAHE